MPTAEPTRSTIKPAHKAIQTYYAALQSFSTLNVTHETGVRTAFQNLLTETARTQKWTLVTEQTLKISGKNIRPDGVMRDEFNLPRGYWEAKDEDDDLNVEIKKKTAKGYPLTNIIFEDSRQAALYQGGQERFRADLTNPQQVADLLNQFYTYTEPDIESFEQAVTEFQERVPELAKGLNDKITAAHKTNKKFQAAWATFFELCKTALNPNISQAAVDEMLVQHLLTERLIRKIFDNPDFMNNNAIAVEIEKVIRALVSATFSREEYLKSLDRFYRAIEDAAHGLDDFTEKQHFLNNIYERFFQGYSVKIADTHGIVYTPQPIVDFMCASVVEVLQTEFGKTLGDPDVVILDPATGTGNFIVNLLRRIPRRDLEHAYKNRLFANEIMLLPYYIAALNIEHAYYELSGQYESFEGLCFVDTLDIAEGAQMRMSFMTEANSARVERQKKAPITVIVGNPPYNVGQVNENDNNKNRTYEVIDKHIRDTYVKDSKATNRNALSDAYVKFFRWAIDRLQGRDGVVCYVSNNGFIDQIAFDGMRKHLVSDFNRIYILDLKGNVRQDSMRDGIPIGPEHTIFGLGAMVGISITILIRNSKHQDKTIYHYAVDWRSKRFEKFQLLNTAKSMAGIPYQVVIPDSKHTWMIPENSDDFAAYLTMGSKDSKAGKLGANAIFRLYSSGVKSNRDNVVYDFNQEQLTERIKQFIEDYNAEVDRYKRTGQPTDIDNFVKYDRIKWSRDLKRDLKYGKYASFSEIKLRRAMYRPFSKQWIFLDPILNQDIFRWPTFVPTPATEQENRVICCTNHSQIPFLLQITNNIPSLDVGGRPTQCFPFYTYDKDSNNRRENITDWALAQFRDHYSDQAISKWDIFYYVYGVLHHPSYREKFADNLKRELPRIPFTPEFRAFAEAGHKLAELHLKYEEVAPYKLDWIEAKDVPFSYRVEKMKLSKDKTQLMVNESLILAGIPPEAFNYRLGNRSALDWVIDQYQVSTDKRSGITSDPNREDDERYIVDLVGRVVTVSVETVQIVKGLPEQYSQ